MTTHEFYHVYSIPHKLLMCVDLPRVEYNHNKNKVTEKEMENARQQNARIAETIEQKLAEAKAKKLNKESKNNN